MTNPDRIGYSLPKTDTTFQEGVAEEVERREVAMQEARESDRRVGWVMVGLLLGGTASWGLFIWLLIGIFG